MLQVLPVPPRGEKPLFNDWLLPDDKEVIGLRLIRRQEPIVYQGGN